MVDSVNTSAMVVFVIAGLFLLMAPDRQLERNALALLWAAFGVLCVTEFIMVMGFLTAACYLVSLWYLTSYTIQLYERRPKRPRRR